MIPLLNRAWAASFARIDSNRRANANRGWFPANRVLLDHPEIEKMENVGENGNSENVQETGETVPNPSSLNLHTGTSGRVFDSLLQLYARNGGSERRKKELDNGDGISASLKSGKKITAGLLMKYGVSNLNKKELI